MNLRVRTIVCGLALVSCVAAAVVAQSPTSSIRCWGNFAFDTRGRDGQFAAVSAGVYTSAVLTTDGRIFVNGQSYYGEGAVPQLPAGQWYTSLSVGNGGGAAITNLGEIVTWGTTWNTIYPGYTNPTVPAAPPLPPGITYVEVSNSVEFLIARRSDGTLVAWGDNSKGQCNIPVLPPGVVVRKFIARGRTAYYVLSDGSIVVAGETTGGQAQVPALPPGVGYVDIYPCRYHYMALRSDGQIVAWGDNTHGQCNVPTLPPHVVYRRIAGGWGTSYATRSDGVIVSWGYNYGQPPVLPPHVSCVQMAAGDFYGIGLLSNGQVVTWGKSEYHQSDVACLTTQVTRHDRHPAFADVSEGSDQTVAVLRSGKILAWGDSENGITSPPTWFDQYAFSKVAMGLWHCAALTTGGEVFAWGDNNNGRATIPALPPGLTYTDVASADQHTILIRSDGSAVGTGQNQDGEVTIPALPVGVRYVACDAHQGKSLLLRSDGQMVSVGSFPPATQHVVPSLPAGMVYTEIAASGFFNSGIRSDGTAVWFGSVSGGGNPGWRPLAVLPRGVYYVEADGGYSHVALRRSDGQIEVCGLVYQTRNAVPPLKPGTSYVQVNAGYNSTTARVGPTSTYVGFSLGCAGSLPPARLVPRDTPAIGKTFELRVFDLPQDTALLAFGLQRLPSPVDLGFVGMPGCELQITVDAVAPLAGQDQQAKWQMAIPELPQWIGLHFFHQALVLDTAAGNTLGAVLSDAAEAVIGDR